MIPDKTILRQEAESRRSITQEVEEKVIANVSGIIESYQPKIVGLYLAQSGEIDLSSLILRYHNTKFAAPKILESEIIFVSYNMGVTLQQNNIFPKYYEPSSNHEVVPDMLLIPGLAFDIFGYRLGKGRGDYDKYLALHPNIIKVGICPADILLERLPHEPHDQRMSHIVTENTIINFK